MESDASARRYFRLQPYHLVLMDAPPPGEQPAAFIAVTRYLRDFGVRVPRVHAADAEQGFVLIEDLGDATFSRQLDAGHPPAQLYDLALEALIRLQHQCWANLAGIDLPEYDESTAVSEAALFTHWYLPARLGHPLNAWEHQEFQTLIANLYRQLPVLDPVLVHRDFHVDNLLLVNERCAMLDYQDALLGSPVYDLVSLLEDARRDVDPMIRKRLIDRWCDRLNLSREVYRLHAAFWGAQRHCKVAGIFVRLWLRDGKPDYLKHLDRVMQLLEAKLSGEKSLSDLFRWIRQRMEPISHQALVATPEAMGNALGPD